MTSLKSRLTEPFAAIGELLRSPDLRRLAFAYGLSLLGLWGYGVAVSVYAFQIGGATLVGIASVIRLVPAAVAAPFAAILADRYPRQFVLLSTDFLRAVLIGLAALAIIADLPPAVVFTLAGLVTVAGTAFEPAKSALLPDLADEPEQLTTANVTMSSFESASTFAGPAIGGFVIAAASVQAAFLVTSVLLLCSAAQLLRIGRKNGIPKPGDSSPDAEDAQPDGALETALAGFRTVRVDSNLRLLFVLTGLQLVVCGLLGVLVVATALDLLETGDAGVGYLNSAIGIGGLLGALAALSLTGSRGLGVALAIGLAAWGAPMAVIGAVPVVAVALVAMALIGVANTIVDASTHTLLQRIAPEEVRGRVYGVLESVIIGSLALGALLAPAFIGLFGIRVALVISGLILPVTALLAAPALRRMDAELAPPARALELLSGISIFAPLGPAALEGLAGSMKPVEVAAGENVVTQGEHGSLFYVIDEGEVEVFEDGRSVRREGPGDHFGEIALLRDVPRTATVTALSDLRLLALERETFLDAVTGHPLASEAAEAVIAVRLRAT